MATVLTVPWNELENHSKLFLPFFKIKLTSCASSIDGITVIVCQILFANEDNR